MYKPRPLPLGRPAGIQVIIVGVGGHVTVVRGGCDLPYRQALRRGGRRSRLFVHIAPAFTDLQIVEPDVAVAVGRPTAVVSAVEGRKVKIIHHPAVVDKPDPGVQ